MTTYAAPIADLTFNLKNFYYDPAASYGALTQEAVAEIIDQGGRFAAETIAPLNRTGDLSGARLEGAFVVTAPGWKEAYEAYASGGWIAASIESEAGGMGLSNVVGTCLQEMLHSSNMAFALCPMLSQAAIKAIVLTGSRDQQQRYLPPLLSGQWTGTMVLTEPTAGSDLSSVRTRAERVETGYRIRGQKIFITYGDHDLTENIIHLVLARTAGPETGTKGLSLFIVPKTRVNSDGSLGSSNDVRCVSLEHKLGIHASPTAYLSFGDNDGCIGELIGEEGRGLEYMFIMMNEARLAVGIQGLGVSERAYQAAVAYANDRYQGRTIGSANGERRSIRFHPDVHRMLMTMRSTCEAMRGLVMYASHCMDNSKLAETLSARKAAHNRLELLVPIAKGWCTESAIDTTSLALQVHGGMGYVEETGVAQHFRDARITTIYEGTTGIQAGDLIGRKIRRDRGVAVRALLDEMGILDGELESKRGPEFEVMRREFARAVASCGTAIDHLLSDACDDRIAAAVSVHFIHILGLTIGAWHLIRSALKADELVKEPDADLAFLSAKRGTAHFFAGQVLPQVRARLPMIVDCSGAVLALYPDGNSS